MVFGEQAERKPPNLFDLQIDHQSNNFLNEAARWSKFLSIVGFIFCGLMVIIALFAGTLLASTMRGFGGGGPAMGSGIVTFVYLIIALLYFFPCLYLFNFSTKMQAALRSNQQDTLNIAFRNLKSCFKYMGILTIVVLSFYILVLIIVVAAGAGSSF